MSPRPAPSPTRSAIALLALTAMLTAASCSDDTTATDSSSTTTAPTTSSSGPVRTTSAPSTTTKGPSTTTTAVTSATTAKGGATTTTTPASSSTPPESCANGSSPAGFDASHGTYAVYLTKLDAATRTLTFDVVQFLVGDDAVAAFHAANPDDPEGPPNDYFITNANTQLRHAVVTSSAGVFLVRLGETGDASLKAGTFAELPAYLATTPGDEGHLSPNPYWLTMTNGSITRICEQYVP